MEHLLACMFSDYLCKHNIIENEYHSVYVYGTELILSFIITVSIILFIGFALNNIISSAVFLAVFIILRRFTGGYHASTYLRCKIVTVSTFLIVLLAAQLIKVNLWIYIIALILGNTVIYFFAPIENPNKLLSDQEKCKFRRLSHVSYTALSITGIIICIWTSINSSILLFSMLAVIALMIISILKKGVKHDDESCKKDG